MNNEELKQKISALFPDAELSEEGSEFLNVTVTNENLRSLAKFLRENEELYFDYMFCLTAIDWITHFTVVYHLTSTKFDHKIVIKAKTAGREDPSVDTVCDIWRTAEFHEREVYDLFGIKFNNHPDLRRILLEDDWVGFPLRKDYKDEKNIVEL